MSAQLSPMERISAQRSTNHATSTSLCRSEVFEMLTLKSARNLVKLLNMVFVISRKMFKIEVKM